MVNEAELKILEMIQAGDITAEEGFRLIDAMGANDYSSGGNQDETQPSTSNILSTLKPELSNKKITKGDLLRIKRLKHWWIIPFGVGTFVTILGTIWMGLSYFRKGFGWGFWLAGFVLFVGLLLLTISFPSPKHPWLHVRIKQKPGEKPPLILFSLPLYIPLTSWFLKTFGSQIPGLKDQPFEDWIKILNHLSLEDPFYVQVSDGDEDVEVFIG